LTGVTDWAEAKVLPFGFSLWGLQTLLGFMDESKGCWTYFWDHVHLEHIFWQRFEENVTPLNIKQKNAIKIGRLLGLLCRHGFKFKGVESIPKDESWDLSLLDGQLFLDEESWMVLV
jgi:hypothetical protein